MARKYTPVKCKWCGEKIEKEEERVKIPITEKSSVNVHSKCELEYRKDKELKQIEYEQWDKLYQYVKVEILLYTKEKQLTPSQRRRLQNLRNGDFVVRGQKISNDGYSYEVILTAFKAKKIEIERATYNKTFEDENHKFNYIMIIVENSIIDIAKRLDRAKIEKAKEELSKQTLNFGTIKTKEQKVKEWNDIQLKKDEDNKVAELLGDIF